MPARAPRTREALDGAPSRKGWTLLGLAGAGVYVAFGVLSFLPRSPIVPAYPPEIGRYSPYPLLGRVFYGSPDALVVAFFVLLVSAFGIFGLALRRARCYPEEVLGPGVWALVFALLLVPTPPIASQDVYSYAAYGRMAAYYYENPYLAGPSKISGDPATNYVGRMWWDMPSVYGPLMQGISWAAARAFGGIESLVLALKGVAAVAFASALWLLQRLARRLSRSAALAVVAVGWNPLVLIHIVGGGHNDILVATALLVALALHLEGRRLLATVALCCGALVKLTALAPLGLYLLFLWRKRDELGGWTKVASVWGLASATIASAYAPFWKGPATLEALVRVSGLDTTISVPAVSARVTRLGLRSLGFEPLAESAWLGVFRGLLGAAFVVYVLYLLRKLGRADELLPEVWGKVLLGFCLTTAYLLPWYLVWPLLVLALVPNGKTFRIAMAVAFVYSFTQLPGGYVLLSPGVKALGEGLGTVTFFAALIAAAAWIAFSRAGRFFDLPGSPPLRHLGRRMVG